MKVILFGGSFDPIHFGHVHIAKAALKQRKADELWFIPTKMSPFKSDSTPFYHRFRMIKLAIKSQKGLYVNDIEEQLPSPSYSIDTIKLLKQQYPNVEFEWLIGSDQLPRLNEWKSIDEINQEVQFIVYNRGADICDTDYPVIKGDFYDISSTDIRLGKSTKTYPAVLSYFTVHSLYLKQRLEATLSQSRFEHIMRVTDLAESLAIAHGIDVNRVRLAALAHDMNKEDSKESLAQLMYKVYPKFESLHPKIYHAFAASHELSHRYYIKDKHVLSAVRNHVLGFAYNDIAKILYIADKCELGRNYDTTPFINAAFDDLNEGFKKVKESAQAYVRAKGNQ